MHIPLLFTSLLSLTDSSVYNQTNDRLYNGNQLQETNTVIAERVRLMTIKQQLAKEAASTSARKCTMMLL